MRRRGLSLMQYMYQRSWRQSDMFDVTRRVAAKSLAGLMRVRISPMNGVCGAISGEE
jgi:hypothetical protein